MVFNAMIKFQFICCQGVVTPPIPHFKGSRPEDFGIKF